MKKEQAIKLFKEEILPIIIKEYGKDDKPAISEAWNNFTDALCKDGEITQHQYNIWTNPF